MSQEGRYLTIDDAIKSFGADILNHLVKTADRAFGTGAFVSPPRLDDGIYTIQPSPDQVPGLITLIGEVGQPVAFLDADYQSIASYTIADGKTGFLQEISFFSNKPLTTQFQVTVGGTVIVTNQLAQASIAIQYGNNDGKGIRLPAGSEVLIEAKSDGAVTTTVTGLIVGTEES